MKNQVKDKNRPNYRGAEFKSQKKKKSKKIELYDNADMIQLFKVSERTLQRWRRENLIPFKKIGGKIYYLAQDVRDMLNQ